MIALQGLNLSMRTIMGKEFARNTRDESFNPLWNHYRCADGKWLALAMLQPDRYWKDLCVAMGLDGYRRGSSLRGYAFARAKRAPR